ncbi:MAG TPA: hypothetical protein VID67_10970 [Rhizomicrobium sp.]|jgi:hypothetical protein
MSDIDQKDDDASSPDRHALRRKQLQYSNEKENRRAVIFEEMETERSVADAKTAKLRAMRLAREAEEAKAAGETEPAPKKKRPIVINTH